MTAISLRKQEHLWASANILLLHEPCGTWRAQCQMGAIQVAVKAVCECSLTVEAVWHLQMRQVSNLLLENGRAWKVHFLCQKKAWIFSVQCVNGRSLKIAWWEHTPTILHERETCELLIIMILPYSIRSLVSCTQARFTPCGDSQLSRWISEMWCHCSDCGCNTNTAQWHWTVEWPCKLLPSPYKLAQGISCSTCASFRQMSGRLYEYSACTSLY